MDELLTRFESAYGAAPQLQVRAPGRINLIGEHTDYHEGFVFPAAIQRAAHVALRANGTNRIRMTAAAYPDAVDVPLDALTPRGGHWADLLLGVVAELRAYGDLGGFDAAVASDVPIGAGLSSSAALACGLGFGLNELFGLGLDRPTLARVGQLAEHRYMHKQCGIMDQMASLLGRDGHFLLLDCRTLDYQYVPGELPGHSILLCQTHVHHEGANAAYNARRAECERGLDALRAAKPGLRTLRDADHALMEAVAPRMDPVVQKRCRYVVAENARVLAAAEALQARDVPRLGALLYATHAGLRDEYEVSVPELDFLVALSEQAGHPGARMVGGGFGGCTLHLLPTDELPAFAQQAAESYHVRFGQALPTYPVLLADGVSLV